MFRLVGLIDGRHVGEVASKWLNASKIQLNLPSANMNYEVEETQYERINPTHANTRCKTKQQLLNTMDYNQLSSFILV